jgi:hypothetical protein
MHILLFVFIGVLTPFRKDAVLLAFSALVYLYLEHIGHFSYLTRAIIDTVVAELLLINHNRFGLLQSLTLRLFVIYNVLSAIEYPTNSVFLYNLYEPVTSTLNIVQLFLGFVALSRVDKVYFYGNGRLFTLDNLANYSLLAFYSWCTRTIRQAT